MPLSPRHDRLDRRGDLTSAGAPRSPGHTAAWRSIDSSFHIVGTIFDTVTKEGVALSRGNAGNWGAQAMDLAPAQGGIVEFRTAEDGLYPIVTHAFNFVGRGALGLVQAGDGDPKN